MDFVFVIPIVHPLGPRVSDYQGVEALLRMTLASLSSQSNKRTATVVTCHQLPDWHAEYDRVTFLTLPESDRFPINYYHRHIDKALKLVAGSQYALSRHSPKFIMPIDGDDLFRTDLAEIALNADPPADGEDGWIITRGLNLDMSRNEDQLHFKAAYNVGYFHRHCGSCRILDAKSVKRVLAEVAPHSSACAVPTSRQGSIELSNAYLEALFSDAAPAFDDLSSRFRLFGDHMRQNSVFRLTALPIELACKTCGHENHVGPRSGEIHWHRVTGRANLDMFISNFGLAASPLVKPDPTPDMPLETMLRPYKAKASVTLQFVLRKSLRFLDKFWHRRIS